MKRNKKSSWKTTLFGILGASSVALTHSGDHNLQTVGNILGPLSIALMGAFSRDNNVTSEEAGAHQ